MSASVGLTPAHRPTLVAGGGPPTTYDDAELRGLLLAHLALCVHPTQLARTVIGLSRAIMPLLAPQAPQAAVVGNRRPLSGREMDVLMGMAGGRSNAQVGRQLHVSEDTVKTCARRLYAKLGVRDRAHAVARAYQCGILAVGPQRTLDPPDADGAPAVGRVLGSLLPDLDGPP